MSILKWLTGSTIAKEGIGIAYSSATFNLSTSIGATVFTGISCVKATTKAFTSPNPICKALYGTSAGLHAVSCASSGACLLTNCSALAPLPVFFGTVGSVASVAGTVCNTCGDCLNLGAGKLIDNCIDECFKQAVRGT